MFIWVRVIRRVIREVVRFYINNGVNCINIFKFVIFNIIFIGIVVCVVCIIECWIVGDDCCICFCGGIIVIIEVLRISLGIIICEIWCFFIFGNFIRFI